MQIQTLLASLEHPPVHIHYAGTLELQREVTALAYDSRKTTPESLFIAVPGIHTDGHRYIRDAAQRGAMATPGEPLLASPEDLHNHSDYSDLPIPSPSRLIVVFGSAGERDVQKRPIMGRIAAQKCDLNVITDEDPREEDREKILQEIAAGAEAIGKRDGSDFLRIADRREAITAAFQFAQPGDTVLLAGKGHEQSIIMGREKVPWDDRQVAREQLKAVLM